MIDFRQHVAIFGTTGSGKSTTLRTLAAETEVPFILWDLKAEARNWPAVHWNGLRIAAYDLPMARYLKASAAGERFLKAVFERRGIIGTLPELDVQVERRYGPRSIKDALLRAIAGKLPAEWIAEPTVNIDDMLASKARHVIQTGRDYADQADWLLGRLLLLPESRELRMIVAFEEAHLLGAVDLVTASKMLRSKGIGLILATQHPRDLGDKLLGNLNTRIYHRLLGGTPGERRYLKEIPPGVESLLVGECIINQTLTRIEQRELAPCEPWPYRRSFARGSRTGNY